MPGFMWDDHPEVVSKLTKLWNEGATSANIAAQLGHGITRCGVIGKAHRLLLPSRSPAKVPLKPRIAPPPKPKPVKAVLPPPPEKPVSLCEPETFVDGRACKFIDGDTSKPGWIMCGHPVKEAKQYCVYHHSKTVDIVRTEQVRRAQRGK